VLRDSSTAYELVIAYRLRNEPTLTNFYLVDFDCYECQGWLAISRRTGQISPLDGRPVASPSHTWLATSHWDDGEFNETRVSVYSLDADTLVPAWSVRPKGWVPDSVTWIDDSTATVLRTHQAFDSLQGLPMTSLHLRFRRSRWHLDSGARAP